MADLIDRKELRDALYEADAVTMQGVKIINQFPPLTPWKWYGVRIADTVKEEPTISFGVITPAEKES